LKAEQNSKREDLRVDVRRLESLQVLDRNEIQTLVREIGALRQEVAALKTAGTTRGLSWAGQHVSGQRYCAGEFCKRADESVWLATKDTTAAPGMDPARGNWF
jgi:hypothetical protein